MSSKNKDELTQLPSRGATVCLVGLLACGCRVATQVQLETQIQSTTGRGREASGSGWRRLHRKGDGRAGLWTQAELPRWTQSVHVSNAGPGCRLLAAVGTRLENSPSARTSQAELFSSWGTNRLFLRQIRVTTSSRCNSNTVPTEVLIGWALSFQSVREA